MTKPSSSMWGRASFKLLLMLNKEGMKRQFFLKYTLAALGIVQVPGELNALIIACAISAD